MKVYLSGPMRHRRYFNFPTFHAIARQLRDNGYKVWSPAEHDEDVCYAANLAMPDQFPGFATGDVLEYSAHTGFHLEDALAWDAKKVIAADVIVMLPGWERSGGALFERLVAEYLGKDVWLAEMIYHGLWGFEPDRVQCRLGISHGQLA